MHENDNARNPSEDFLEKFFDILFEESVEVFDFDIRYVLDGDFVKFPGSAYDLRMEQFSILRKHESSAFEMNSREQCPTVRIADIRNDQYPLFLHQGPQFGNMGRKSVISSALGFSGSTGSIPAVRLLLGILASTGSMWTSRGNHAKNV